MTTDPQRVHRPGAGSARRGPTPPPWIPGPTRLPDRETDEGRGDWPDGHEEGAGIDRGSVGEFGRVDPDMGHLARRTVTVEEAAAMLGIGRSTAFDLVTSGQLQSFTIGRRRLVVVSGIDEFVRRRLAESA